MSPGPAGGGWDGELLLHGYGASVWEDEMFWKRVTVTVANRRSIPKTTEGYTSKARILRYVWEISIKKRKNTFLLKGNIMLPP